MKRFLCVVMAALLYCTCALAEEAVVPGAEEAAPGLHYEAGYILPDFALKETKMTDTATLLESMTVEEKISQLIMPAF